VPYYPTHYYPTHYYSTGYFPSGSGSSSLPTTIRRAVTAALKADTAVAEIVGAKVYPLAQLQSVTTPSLVYVLRSDVPGQTLSGPDGTSLARFDFTCLTKSLDDGEALADATRDVFDGLTNTILSGSSCFVLESYKLDEDDEYIPPIDATPKGTIQTPVSVMIRYRKPSPR
jgi:hypothetical protein